MSPFPNPKAVSIYHLPTTAGSSQGYPASPDLTTTGGFQPLNRHQAALAGVDLIEPAELYLEATADVRPNDKVTIGGDTSNWYVKHIFKADFGGLAHQRVTIAKNA